MTFFEQQQRARRKTGILVLYFILAIILIILAINAVFYIVALNVISPPPALSEWLSAPWWKWIAAGTLLVIILGTLNTLFKLRGGGRAVAEMVGARRIKSNTDDLNERKLINVVEEMSIASGTTVPVLYVLDDEVGINAFVAGLRPTEAVLVVTRGTLEALTRDELQGVVAHEYSHIMHGDMRINVRLLGILAGILIISQVGRIMLRSSGRGRSKNGNQGALIGLALFLIGYIGYFFGALIKAAISRQREFLADASAVQFTRNPDGIAGALWKIKKHINGSMLNNAHSDELSHFCFGAPMTTLFSSLMATHPPLDTRINAINPRFIPPAIGEPESGIEPGSSSGNKQNISVEKAGAAPVTAISASIESVINNVGQVNPAHIGFAAALLSSMPGPVETSVHHPDGARQVLYAMLLGAADSNYLDKGLMLVQAAESVDFKNDTRALLQPLKALGERARLPLLNIAMPTLKELPEEVCNRLLDTVKALIKLDGRLSIFEFALLAILKEHLNRNASEDVPVKYFSFRDVSAEISLLLSVMARVGNKDESVITVTYQKIMKQFTPEPGTPAIRADCTLDALNDALHELNRASPLLKQSIIQACADCIIHDNKVLDREAEMLQAVSVSLDCPMPPLV